jgi:hypothetical protein
LSTVELPDDPEEEPLRADLAIASISRHSRELST